MANAGKCRSRSSHRREQLLERAGAMGEWQFLIVAHLAERAGMIFWFEDRIVAEALLPARRPDNAPARLAFEHIDPPSRLGQSQRTHEARAAVLGFLSVER